MTLLTDTAIECIRANPACSHQELSRLLHKRHGVTACKRQIRRWRMRVRCQPSLSTNEMSSVPRGRGGGRHSSAVAKVGKAMKGMKAGKAEGKAGKAMKSMKVGKAMKSMKAGKAMKVCWKRVKACATQALDYGSELMKTSSMTEAKHLYWCVSLELLEIRREALRQLML